MATTPIQAHHMLGEEDVHIRTSISCWRHPAVCWAGRVGGGGGGTGIAAHVHMYCMDVRRVAVKCGDGVGQSKTVLCT